MNKKFFAGLITAILLSGCGMSTIQQGEVGLVINKYSGQIEQVTDPGFRMTNGFNKYILRFPTRKQQYVMVAGSEGQHKGADDSVKVNSLEGQVFNVDASIEYQITNKDVVPALYKKYGKDFEDIVEDYYRSKFQSAIVTAFSSLPLADSITGAGREKAEKAALDKLQEQLGPDGITVNAVLVRAVHVPSAISESIANKTKAEAELVRSRTVSQQKVVEAQAEAQARLIRAESEAKANNLVAASLNDRLLRKLYIEKLAGDIKMVVPEKSFFNFGGVVPDAK